MGLRRELKNFRRFFMPFCHAVGAEKALYNAAFQTLFCGGKGFMPFPSKSAF